MRAKNDAGTFVTLSSGLAFLIAAIFLWIVFSPSDVRKDVSSACVLPGPSILSEFAHPSTAYCFGAFTDPAHLKNSTSAKVLARCTESITQAPLSRPCDGSQLSWAPAPMRKISILLIDALRWNWLAWDPSVASWNQKHNSRALKVPLFSPATLTEPPHATNSLPIIHSLLSHNATRDRTRLFRQFVDTPTMTTQRIRAIMNGDITPFSDITKTFAGSLRPNEDSLLQQIKRSKRGRSIAMGDDTWGRLYDDVLDSSIVKPPGVMADLDSDDDLAHQALWKLLRMRQHNLTALEYNTVQNQKILERLPIDETHETRLWAQWDFLVAHLLGSDKACHSRGVHSAVLRQKFDLYDKMIANEMHFLTNGALGAEYFSQFLPRKDSWHAKLPSLTSTYYAFEPAGPLTFDSLINLNATEGLNTYSDTLFLVLGDHGMSDLGSHGGASKNEVEAGLFVYSPCSLVPLQNFFTSEAIRESLPSLTTDAADDPKDPNLQTAHVEYSDFYKANKYSFRSVDQIDLTPTLAVLLGLPVPATSVGNLVPELIPLYDRRQFWMGREEYESKSLHSSLMDPSVPDLAPFEKVWVIRCTKSSSHKDDFDARYVTHPLIADARRRPKAEVLDLECKLAFADHPHAASLDQRAARDVPAAKSQISRLRWLRHLRYLQHLHHHVAWQVRRTVSLHVQTSRSGITWSAIADAWKLVEKAVTQALSTRAKKWGELMEHVEAFEAGGDLQAFARAETWLVRHAQVITGKRCPPTEADSQPACIADLDFVLASEIERVERSIARYRTFVSRSQRLIRKAQSSSFCPSRALWLAIIPLTVVVLLMSARVVTPRKVIGADYPFDRVRRVRLLRRLWWSPAVALLCLYLNSQRFVDHPAWPAWLHKVANESTLIAVCALCLGVWTCIAFQIKWLWWYLCLPRVTDEEEGTLRSVPDGPHAILLASLVPNRCSTSSFWGDLWDASIRGVFRGNRQHEIASFCERQALAKFHWVFVLTHVGAKFCHGAAVDAPGIFTRFLLQDLCLWLLVKSVGAAWIHSAVADRESTWQARSQLKVDSLKLLALWTGVVGVARLSDCFDPHYVSPWGISSQPMRLDLPDGVAALITTATALLLWSLFPADQTARALRRIYHDKMLSTHYTDVLHYLRHLLALGPRLTDDSEASSQTPRGSPTASFESGPSQPASASFRRLPSVVGFPSVRETSEILHNEKALRRRRTMLSEAAAELGLPFPGETGMMLSPDLCCSSGHADYGSPPQAATPPPDIDQREAAPLASLLRRTSAAIFILQGLAASVYFSAFIAANDAVAEGHTSTQEYKHAAQLIVLAGMLGVSPSKMLSLSGTKALLILMPRLSWLLSAAHLAALLTHVWNFRKWPEQLKDVPVIAIGWLFYLALPCHDANEAAILCLQALAVPMLVTAVSQTLTFAEMKRDEELIATSQTLATNAVLLHQTLGRIDHAEARKAVKFFDSQMAVATTERMTLMANTSQTFRTTHSAGQKLMEPEIRAKTFALVTDEECVSLIFLLAYHWTLASGHRADINAIPLNAGFVGLTTFAPVPSVTLIILHCTVSFCAAPLLLVHLLCRRPAITQDVCQRGKEALRRLWTLTVISLLVLNVHAVYILRNDFPAWRNYAPMYLIEAVILLTTFPFYYAMNCFLELLAGVS